MPLPQAVFRRAAAFRHNLFVAYELHQFRVDFETSTKTLESDLKTTEIDSKNNELKRFQFPWITEFCANGAMPPKPERDLMPWATLPASAPHVEFASEKS